MLNSDFHKLLIQNNIDPRASPLSFSSALYLSLTPILNMFVAYTFLTAYDEILERTVEIYNRLSEGENDNE